jgi:UDP-glucose 4-epimerase
VVDTNVAGQTPSAFPRDWVFANIDIRDIVALESLFGAFSPDVVIHLAAIHHIPTCEIARTETLSVNVVGTETVLDAATRSGVKRLILASSGAVYDWSPGPLDEERSAARPADNYSLSKYTNELQSRLWTERTGGQVLVARLFNVIGPGDRNAHLVPDVLSQIRSTTGQSVVALGNLESRRDYIDVRDAASGLIALARTVDEKPLDVFNLCSGREVSVEGLVQRLAAAIDTQISVKIEPSRRRKLDRPSQLGSPDKARSILGFEARITLDEALRNLLEKDNLLGVS